MVVNVSSISTKSPIAPNVRWLGRYRRPNTDDHLGMAMSRADAARRAARARQAYAEGVAYERITIDPNRMSGLPCIRDTRVTVSAVLGQLAAGLTIPELLADFPYLDRDDVLAALEFAAAAVQERELPLAHSA
jgi:uncharacterized protein (DUF433 family)